MGDAVMLHAGLDLSRRRLDVCVLSDEAELVEELAAPPDAEGLRYLVSKLARHGQPVRAVTSVDDRRAVRPRHARAAGVGGVDRRRAAGQGTGAVGVQDRPGRFKGAPTGVGIGT